MDLAERIAAVQPLGEAVCAALQQALQRQGLHKQVAAFTSAQYELHKDPFDGQESLKAIWSGAQGYGHIPLYPNGIIYAEYDVLLVHPQKPQWFVEAVTAWGNANEIKTELRLLPALD